MEKRVSAMEVRKHLGEILEKIHYHGDTFIIQRAAKPMAVLVPVKQYEQWQLRREQFFALIDQVQERTSQESTEELEEAIAEAVTASKQTERSTVPAK